ncbi:MAG: EamA family transporter [Candidatus Harrisonbacteria bacterium]|nr:EamA family transporter [Candidatus Harrisonbacteria bacterium]
MFIWLLLALGSALTNSWVQALSKTAVAVSRYSKITISFVAMACASLILISISYFLIGIPVLQEGFWFAVFATGILNTIAFPTLLRAYQLGEFSSVYSMILLTPVFMILTSFLILGETPSMIGIIGVLLTVSGLWFVFRVSHKHAQSPNFTMGNILGIIVAFIYSLSVNFDKLMILYSDRVFAPGMAIAIMAGGYAIYLLLKHGTLLVKITDQTMDNNAPRFKIPGVFILLALGVLMAGSNVLHVSALAVGLASYTIAVKRTGVLFGVFWGWLFFKEKNIGKKLVGVAIAIAGVVVILFS